MQTLKTVQTDFLPNPAGIEDLKTRRFCEDLVAAFQKLQKNVHSDFARYESAVADATGTGDVVAQFNTLLDRLRSLRIIDT